MYGEECFMQKRNSHIDWTWVCHYEPKLKHTNSPAKKKFRAQQSMKKVMQTVFLDMKGPIATDFFEKGAVAHSASNSKLFKQNSPHLLNDPRIINQNVSIFIHPIKCTLTR